MFSQDAVKLLHQKILKILEKEKIEFSQLDDKNILERLRHLLGYFRFGNFCFITVLSIHCHSASSQMILTFSISFLRKILK